MYFINYSVDGCDVAMVHRKELDEIIEQAQRMIIGGRSNEPLDAINALNQAAKEFDVADHWMIDVEMDYAIISIFKLDEENYVVVSDN